MEGQQPPPDDLTPAHGLLGFVVALLTALVGAGSVLAWYAQAHGLGLEAALAAPAALLWSTLTGQLCLLAGVATTLVIGRADLQSGLGWRSTSVLNLVLGAVGTLAASVAADALVAALRRWLPASESILDELGRVLRALPPGQVTAVLLGFALIPALCEEPLFRGAVQTAFRRRWSPAAAIGGSAVLFALLHFDPMQSPAALVLGLYLGLLRERSGSLWTSIAGHAANNAVAAVVLWQGAAEVTELAWPYVLAAAALAVACLAGQRGSRC